MGFVSTTFNARGLGPAAFAVVAGLSRTDGFRVKLLGFGGPRPDNGTAAFLGAAHEALNLERSDMEASRRAVDPI